VAGLATSLVGCGDGPAPEVLSGEDLVFPAPPGPKPVSSVSNDDFAGADACAACHQDQFDLWQGSTHGRAGGAAVPDVLIAPFDGTPIRFADGIVIPRRAASAGGGAEYEFLVRQDGFAEQVVPVAGVVGGGHMLGGGTQGFFTNWVDGTVRFLAWDWSRAEGEWFCNTGTRLDQGWVTITPGMRMADCGDWPPTRVLGTEARFSNCQGCHGSQIRLTRAPEGQDGFATRLTTLQVNCESCHGPGAEHIRRAEAVLEGESGLGAVASGGFGADGVDLGIESLAIQSKDESLRVCFQCHALKDVLNEDYLPGDSLELFYALKFPILGDEPFFADARVKTFAYQGTHLASACYLDGAMDCVSCHEPHAQGYWDQHRNDLASPFDDGQCTSCHGSKMEPLEAHTFHAPESEGSRCVNCHMPYLQHPEVGPGVGFARSDHTIPNPRPGFEAELGVESSCIQCHEDLSPAELDRQVREWWGELKPHRPLVSGQRAAATERSRTRAAELLLRPDLNDPLIQFQALSRFLVERLEPDLPGLEEPVRDRLLDLTRSPDLDVRALALAALHWSRGDDPTVRAALVEALRGEPGWALRQRWILALGFLGDEKAGEGDLAGAEAAYRKSLELSPDDPRVLAARGLALYQAGEFQAAAESLLRSLAGDPDASLTRVNLGMTLAAMGDGPGAQRAYTQVIETDPTEPLAWFNLANLLQRAERLEEAAAAYQRAIDLDPGLQRAHFFRARALILMGRIPEALTPARRALELDPDYPPAQEMVRDLERALTGG
jgi:tetratricopeptide (TPR) repeat protein